MQFDFPLLPMDRFSKCQSNTELRQTIRRQLVEIGLQRKCRYLISYSTVKFLYAKCSLCKAYLRFKLFTNENAESYYILKKYVNHHVHKITKLTKKQQAIDMLQNLPPGIEPISMKAYVSKKLDISQYTFYSALKQMEGSKKGIDFKTLLPYLQQKGYVVFEPFPIERVVFFPQLCLCITQNMKQAYLKYGRFIGIDFTYNLIRQIPYLAPDEQNNEINKKKKKPKQWITGIISGLDSARRLLIYGIAFCYSQTSDSIQKILDNFFQIMGRKCQTIISDGGLGIEQAVKRLQSREVFLGTHLLDAYHVMANLRVQYNNSQILRKLYLAADEEQYYNIFEAQIAHMEPNEQRKLGKFDSLAHRFCMSKIPATFVGLGSSTSMSQKINDLIKSIIPRETSFSEVITKILRLSDKINIEQPYIKYQSYPFESILGASWLKDLRIVLNKYVFQRLIRQLFKSIQLQYSQCRRLCTLQDIKYFCECKFQEKSGLPCRHIIKILIMQQKPIVRQIDEYWIQSGEQQVFRRRKKMLAQGHRKIKIGRPRNSRRNIKK